MKVKMLDELQMKNIGIPSNLHRDNGRSLMVINLWVKKQEKVGDVVPKKIPQKCPKTSVFKAQTYPFLDFAGNTRYY